MKQINVSRIQVRQKPSEPSKVYLNRGMIVRTFGPPVNFKGEQWIRVITMNKPIVKGYLPSKYLSEI